MAGGQEKISSGDDSSQNRGGFTIQDLEVQKVGLEDRIKRLETDLQSPLSADFSEQASQTSQHLILRRILEVEKANLRKLNFELELKKQQHL